MSKNTNNDSVGERAMAVGCAQALLGSVFKLHPSTRNLAACLQYIGGFTAAAGLGTHMAAEMRKPVLKLVDPETMAGLLDLMILDTAGASFFEGMSEAANAAFANHLENDEVLFSALFNEAVEAEKER